MIRHARRSTMRRTLLPLLLLFALPAPAEKDATVQTRHPLPSSDEIAALPSDGGPEFNRLIFSSSPYLRQHARNPVDWYPWGDEAFEKARREDKPIFLSVGYSSCHWCHVMEHESFEHTEVAALLNARFVSVKVDREERPDVDAIYMHATQLFTGRGGWPNSLFLNHDRLPFFAGTYWPREDRGGRPGFVSILKHLSTAWTDNRDGITEQTKQVANALQRMSYSEGPDTPETLSSDLADRVLLELEGRFDSEQGGFGRAPKFPPHSALSFLLYEERLRPKKAQEDMILRTLDEMARGGIHDHVGGGFHRYATDDVWFLPHFEKMLYDNGQLARSYALAYEQFQHPEYARVLEGLCDWVLRQMRSPEGSFFSAYDADSEGEEGLYYIWTLDELNEILGPVAGASLATTYGATREGTYHEEATGSASGANILFLPTQPETSLEEWAGSLKLLREFRESQRVPPMLDDKVIVSWNGLMIGGLATAGRVLQNDVYIKAASAAADAILTHHREANGRLLRIRHSGRSHLHAVVDDYAFLAAGLLDLHEASGEARWTEEARRLMLVLEDDFSDGEGGYFFAEAGVENELPVRHRDPFDNATPSGVGIAAQVWARLGDAKRTEGVLRAFAHLIQRAPQACENLVIAQRMLQDQLPADPAGTAAWSKKVDVVSLSLDRNTVNSGSNLLTLTVSIDSGWHVNANPASEKFLVPTGLTLSGSGARIGTIEYPKGQPFSTEASKVPISVYEGEITLSIPLEIDPDAADLMLNITTQACKDRSCLEPQTVNIPLTIADRTAP